MEHFAVDGLLFWEMGSETYVHPWSGHLCTESLRSFLVSRVEPSALGASIRYRDCGVLEVIGDSEIFAPASQCSSPSGRRRVADIYSVLQGEGDVQATSRSVHRGAQVAIPRLVVIVYSQMSQAHLLPASFRLRSGSPRGASVRWIDLYDI